MKKIKAFNIWLILCQIIYKGKNLYISSEFLSTVVFNFLALKILWIRNKIK